MSLRARSINEPCALCPARSGEPCVNVFNPSFVLDWLHLMPLADDGGRVLPENRSLSSGALAVPDRCAGRRRAP